MKNKNKKRINAFPIDNGYVYYFDMITIKQKRESKRNKKNLQYTEMWLFKGIRLNVPVEIIKPNPYENFVIFLH